MSDAEAAGQKVVFVSLGSEVTYQQWYVDAIYNGCVQLNNTVPIRVVWGLRTTDVSLPEGYDKQMFWVDSWVP